MIKHITIIIAFLMAFGTQVAADGKWNCSEFDIPCSDVGFSSDICDSDPNATLTGFILIPEVDDQTCPTQCNVMNKIYDNCFVDKMKGTSKVATQSVRRSCERIACNPTFFQKLRYK